MVFDAVYTPRKTTLLKDAEAAGAITVSGVEMFLRQAIGQFHLFTGSKGNFLFFYMLHGNKDWRLLTWNWICYDSDLVQLICIT